MSPARSRLVRALGTAFSFLLFNLAFVVVCAALLTIPVAMRAAFVALDKWRDSHDDRLVRAFFFAVVRDRPVHNTLAVGVPLAGLAIAAEEVHYFAFSPGLSSRVYFGLGLCALVLAVTAIGYVLLLAARVPDAPVTDLWAASVRFAMANLVVTAPLFLIEGAVATFVGLADPALVFMGLPVAFLYVLHRGAAFGIRRAAPAVPGAPYKGEVRPTGSADG